MNSDPVLSREICVPAGTPVKRWKTLQSMAQNADRPDPLAVELTWQGRECINGHRAKCLGPPTACEPHLGPRDRIVFYPFETEA